MFFAAAHREWRLSIQNDTGAPYGAAQNATAHLEDRYLQQEAFDAIVNLATATASDCAAISQLTSTVKILTAELVIVNSKLVTSLHTQCASRGGRGRRGRGHRAGAGDPAQTRVVVASRAKEQYLDPPIRYCWTCGPRCRHNSAKCPALETVHIYTATKRDMQGGAEATK